MQEKHSGKIKVNAACDVGLEREETMIRQVALALAMSPTYALAASVQCILGTTACISSQDTRIPSKQAIKILDSCDEFTRNDIGRLALRLSSAEIHEKAAGRITPLVRAWYAFDDIYDSPLKFDRKAKAEDTKYWQIKQSCQQLTRDFNDDTKWTK